MTAAQERATVIPSAPVFIQSFEQANLEYLNSMTNVRLVHLVDGDSVDADGIGPTSVFADARARGLLVAHLDLPERAAPARVDVCGRPRQRIPGLLSRRHRRRVRGCPRRRLRCAGAVPARS